MPSARLEPAITASKRPQTHAHRYLLFSHLTPDTVCSLARSPDAEGPSESVYIFCYISPHVRQIGFITISTNGNGMTGCQRGGEWGLVVGGWSSISQLLIYSLGRIPGMEDLKGEVNICRVVLRLLSEQHARHPLSN